MRALDKSEIKILSAFLFILATLGFLGIYSRQNSQRVQKSAEEIDRSQEIKFHLQKAFTLSSVMASAARVKNEANAVGTGQSSGPSDDFDSVKTDDDGFIF